MDAKTFGSYLKQLRNNKGFTLTELGELIGYSNPYLSQIENGKKGIPSPDILKKLSIPLEVDYGSLMYKAGYLDDGSLLVDGYLTNPRSVIEQLIKSAADGVIVDGVTVTQQEALERFEEQNQKNEFGVFIRELREKRGLTLSDLSKISGIPQDQLSELENGTSSRNRPKPEVISKLSFVLGPKLKDEMLSKAGYNISPEENHLKFDGTVEDLAQTKQLMKLLDNAAENKLDKFLEKPSVYYKAIELKDSDKERILSYVEGLLAERLTTSRGY